MLFWGLQLSGFRYVKADQDVTAGGYTWAARVMPTLSFSALSSPQAGLARLAIVDEGSELLNLLQSGKLISSSATLWRLEGNSLPLNATLLFSGQVERAVISGPVTLFLDIGPHSLASWKVPRYGPLCRYRSTTQCPYALTCAKSFAACQANNKTEIFGGFRYLPPAGFRVIWRETEWSVK